MCQPEQTYPLLRLFSCLFPTHPSRLSYQFISPSPPMRRVISSMRSIGNGGALSGRMAMLISFIHRCRLHNAAAVGCTVARLNVNMQTGQTVRAVVAVIGSGRLRRDEPSADTAGKAVAAGVCPVISLFKGFSFIFSVHCDLLR